MVIVRLILIARTAFLDLNLSNVAASGLFTQSLILFHVVFVFEIGHFFLLLFVIKRTPNFHTSLTHLNVFSFHVIPKHVVPFYQELKNVNLHKRFPHLVSWFNLMSVWWFCLHVVNNKIPDSLFIHDLSVFAVLVKHIFLILVRFHV